MIKAFKEFWEGYKEARQISKQSYPEYFRDLGEIAGYFLIPVFWIIVIVTILVGIGALFECTQGGC